MKLEKITEHDQSNKCITTQEFDQLTAENFAAKLSQEKLATKADIAGFIKRDRFS